MIKNYQKGITAVELLIALSVLALIFAVFTPQFHKIRENQVLKSAISDILSNINKAQSQTLSSLNSSSYGIYFEEKKVVIFKGAAYSSEDPSNEITVIISPASISNVTLSGSSGESGELYFERLSGIPSHTGTVTVSTGSFSKVITISATGSASVNQ